eukprot:snap_masked-scaffold_45-processed-gene-1.83-mRNA-1 protein AED:1.00 eAED:1.00 QI:0/0/0/0/1/1/2/0/172
MSQKTSSTLFTCLNFTDNQISCCQTCCNLVFPEQGGCQGNCQIDSIECKNIGIPLFNGDPFELNQQKLCCTALELEEQNLELVQVNGDVGCIQEAIEVAGENVNSSDIFLIRVLVGSISSILFIFSVFTVFLIKKRVRVVDLRQNILESPSPTIAARSLVALSVPSPIQSRS